MFVICKPCGLFEYFVGDEDGGFETLIFEFVDKKEGGEEKRGEKGKSERDVR